MHSGESLPIIEIGSPMSEALIKISEKGFGCIGVVSNNSLEGIITDGDLRRHMGPDMLNNKVESIMTKNPQMVSSKLLVADALELINNLGIQGLFVSNNNKIPIGFIHFHDLIRVIKG